MRYAGRHLLAAALSTALAAGSGCSNSPPGAGFTSGDKGTFTSDEKPAVRDDLKGPAEPGSGDAKLADSAAIVPDPGAGAGANAAAKPAAESGAAAPAPDSAPAPGAPPAPEPK